MCEHHDNGLGNKKKCSQRSVCISALKSVSCSVMSASLRPHGLPGSSVHGILQAKIRQWATISFSRGSSRLRDWIRVSCVAGRCFTIWATREAPEVGRKWPNWALMPSPSACRALAHLVTTVCSPTNCVPWEHLVLPRQLTYFWVHVVFKAFLIYLVF